MNRPSTRVQQRLRRSARRAIAILLIAMMTLVWPLAVAAQMNVALSGVASQSSDFLFQGVPASASRAIDGNTNGNFVAGSVTHTQGPGDSSPSWQVDLGSDHQIDEIVIWNRTDCCEDRLYLFTVRIENEAGDEVGLGKVFNPPVEVDFRPQLPVGGVVGRFVRIDFDFDPANSNDRVLSLAEVQVFGLPITPPELPLGRNLTLDGRWTQKMKTTWDGPKDSIEEALAKFKKKGIEFKNDEIPYQCSQGLGGDKQGSIRFDSGETDRFELRDAYGNLVTGSFVRKGVDGQKIKLKPDAASEKSLKRILDLSASHCARITDLEDESGEKFLGLSVKLDKAVLKGKIKDERFVLSGKITGEAKWKRKAKKLGKFYGSGRTTHTFRWETSIVEPPVELPGACVAGQGPHIYPQDNALLEGWVELTEIIGSDMYYLILTDHFVSILEDFEEDSGVIHTLLRALDEHGTECDASGRSVVSVELSESAKNNILSVIGTFENLELGVSSQQEATENAIIDIGWNIIKDAIKKQIRKLIGKIIGKIIARFVKAAL